MCVLAPPKIEPTPTLAPHRTNSHHLTSYISHLTSHISHLTSHISHLTLHRTTPNNITLNGKQFKYGMQVVVVIVMVLVMVGHQTRFVRIGSSVVGNYRITTGFEEAVDQDRNVEESSDNCFRVCIKQRE